MAMSLLPNNTTTFEQDIEATLSRLSNVDVSTLSTLWNVDTCPTNLLPWLAWAENVDEWSILWTEDVQRAVIKAQRLIRRTRGTKTSVKAAVLALSGSVSFKEWYEYSSPCTPHTFDITITGGNGYIEEELQNSMIRAIDRNKPVRSHYTLGVGLTSAGSLNLIGTAMAATYKRMEFTD